jgi:hypothetical protein
VRFRHLAQVTLPSPGKLFENEEALHREPLGKTDWIHYHTSFIVRLKVVGSTFHAKTAVANIIHVFCSLHQMVVNVAIRNRGYKSYETWGIVVSNAPGKYSSRAVRL